MPDIVVDDIPEEHYLWICEEAAKFGITLDDYLTLMVKENARELLARKAGQGNARLNGGDKDSQVRDIAKAKRMA